MNYETNKSRSIDKKFNKIKNEIICLWCNQKSQIIWVHGHGQCSNCGYNIDECCRGESVYNHSFNDNDKSHIYDIYHE